MITKKLPLHIDDIKKAQTILDRNVRKTPLVKSFYLTSKTGGEIHLKLENMQLTGSFKFRGAFNKMSQLTDQEKERGVIACSPGN
ncbi:pyridoxal-phosphate dependent enzyme, partial [Bacillus tropicus]|uniref:pyridoxal-phosphate dependent enzyme n=1 Tax=Bacillus tropicus TaxID=2026188 RepID=UPI002DBD828A